MQFNLLFKYPIHPIHTRFNFLFKYHIHMKQTKKDYEGDFPGSPVVKNLPCKAGDVGLIPSRRTKIPQAMEQLSPRVTTTETALRTTRKDPCNATKIPYAATKTQHAR